jgi:hypothetical protein
VSSEPRFLPVIVDSNRLIPVDEGTSFSTGMDAFLLLVDDYKLDEVKGSHYPIIREARNDEQGLSAYLLEVT